MKTLLAVAVAILTSAPLTTIPADAQSRSDVRDSRRDVAEARRDCRHDLRHADSRGEYRRELRDCRHDIGKERREYRKTLRSRYRHYR